ADVAAGRAQVLFEGGLLGRAQDVARGREEDHGPVLGEVGGGEGRGVLGGGDGEVVRRSEVTQGRDALVDRGVAEARRPGEDEDAVRRVGRRGGRTGPRLRAGGGTGYGGGLRGQAEQGAGTQAERSGEQGAHRCSPPFYGRVHFWLGPVWQGHSWTRVPS